MKIDSKKLLKKLILMPSVSENEGQICQFVFDYLKSLGLKPIKIAVDENGFNIVVKVGRPKIYLSAHLDTVGPIIDYKEDGKKIRGRGSCDMKGAVATMIVAVKKAKDEGLKDFGLILTVGEESTFRGINKIMEKKMDIPFVVVGEPTSLELVNGHFGLIELEVVVKGKRAHSCSPQEGENAIEKLLEAIKRVRAVKLHPESLMNLATIGGGVAPNIVPDRASIGISIRVSPKDKNNYIKLFKKAVDDLAKIEIGVEVDSQYSEVPKELSFLKRKGVVRYMTELSFYGKGVVLGPGDIKNAHGDNEYVLISELYKAEEIYGQIIRNYGE